MPSISVIVRRAFPVIFAALVVQTAARAQADDYPERSVRIIVPSGPGGGFDLVGRVMAPALSERLKQNFFVENRTGAGTLAGSQAAAAATPDGYTLLVGGLSNLVANAALYEKLPYDPAADFTPIALVYNVPFAAILRKDFPADNLQEFIAYVRSHPGEVTVAHAGVGTGPHLMSVALQQMTGTRVLEVSYKGSQLAYPDLLSGRTDAIFDTTASARPYVESGAVKAIAILCPHRMAGFPGVPTSAEAGLSGWQLGSWIGLVAPAKTSPVILARLRAATEDALMRPTVRGAFEATGEVIRMDPAETDSFIKSEFAKWTKIIRNAEIRAN